MYSNELKVVKKGFIMLYTLLIGVLCILIALYLLKFQYNNMNNATLLKNNSCATPILYNSKEYLLTKLKALVIERTTELTEDKIKAFFLSNEIGNFTYNQCYLKYDNINNVIIMVSYVDEYFHREDYYIWKINDSNMNFIYRNTIFKEGRSKQC